MTNRGSNNNASANKDRVPVSDDNDNNADAVIRETPAHLPWKIAAASAATIGNQVATVCWYPNDDKQWDQQEMILMVIMMMEWK